MNRRDGWRKVLASEVERWSAKSCDKLVAELHELQAYEVETDSQPYQVEVEALECTEDYIHVSVSVDDGTLPASIKPETDSFIRRRTPSKDD